MSAADMTGWDSRVAERFKVLLDVRAISGDVGGQVEDDGEDGVGDDGDKAKLKRVAIVRNQNALDVQAAHDALAALAFSGYQDWCEYDDDDWLRNCLGQVLDDEQSNVLVSALENADLLGLAAAVKKMADTYVAAWERAAEHEFAEADSPSGAGGLNFAENTESWKYSRTPGTRYYIFRDGLYLYSDNKDAPLAGWATAGARDDEAASRATEWESGSAVFYTPYEDPSQVGGVTHVFGRSKDGPWVLTRSQAERLLIASPQPPAAAVGAASPIEPYFDTGHFTKYQNDAYFFGESADTGTWHRTYQELLDTLAERERPAEDEDEDLDELADALAELFEAIPEAADMPTDELYEAIMRGAQKRA